MSFVDRKPNQREAPSCRFMCLLTFAGLLCLPAVEQATRSFSADASFDFSQALIPLVQIPQGWRMAPLRLAPSFCVKNQKIFAL